MYKIIGGDKKEYGPVSAEQVFEWVREGRANGGTLVQSEESDEWRPLSEYPEFAAALPTSSSPGGAFSSLVQAQAQTQSQPREWASGESPVVYDFSIADCYSRSWAMFKSNWSLFMTSTLLVLILGIGIGLIPIFGFFASVILYGPLYGGLYLLYLKVIRREPAQIQDIFEGFSRSFVPLMLGGVVPNLLIFLSSIFCFLAIPLVATRVVPESIGLILIFIGLIPPIYLGVAWSLVLPLIIDRGMDFWPAMELSRRAIASRWIKMFGLFLLGGILNVIGVLFMFVGLLVTIPLLFGAVMCAYEDIFNGPQRPTY